MSGHQGLRYNQGKNRLDLIPPYSTEQVGLVLTRGAEKYAPRNWEKGMSWMSVLASLKRHLLAFEKGEDFDKESELLHMSHVLCNAMFLVEYYKIYPQGDDRPHHLRRKPKVGLDVDEVLADFIGGYRERFGVPAPNAWNFDREMKERFEKLKDDKEFWMNLKPLVNPEDLPFEPTCYITSRPVPNEWTEEWLSKHNFPAVPVITTQEKVQSAKEMELDWFVDDKYSTFLEMTSAGICCYLFSAPHNERYNVGYRRIESLTELDY